MRQFSTANVQAMDARSLYQRMCCKVHPVARAPSRKVTWHVRGQNCHAAARELLGARLVGLIYLPGGYAVLDVKPGRRS